MAVSSPCYVTRDELMLALDFQPTQRTIVLVDRAIQSATGDIHGLCHRLFYPEDATRYFDWPNFQYAYPWRIWLDDNELASKTNVTVTSGGVAIPSNQILWRSSGGTGWDDKPPFVAIELDRSTSAAFGVGSTPQRDVAITGTFGYSLDFTSAGTLAADVSSSSTATITVSDASQMGVGDILLIGTERMLVASRAMTSTTVSFSGPSTANASDNLIAVPDVTQFGIGEVLLLDAERMFITDIAGSNLVVKRAWQGTVLAAHTSGTIYAERLLTVARGALGTTASTYTQGTALSRFVPPALITELALAMAETNVLQKMAGYARTIGEGDNLRPAPGVGLADIKARAYARYGRKARSATV